MKIVMPVQRAEARVSAVSPEAERLAIPYAAMGTRNGEKASKRVRAALSPQSVMRDIVRSGNRNYNKI
jgi:hypothetical protein